MRTIASFDPSTLASGQIVTQAVNPCTVVVLFNHSLFGLSLTFPDGSTANLPPWYFRYYYLAIPGNVSWSKSFALTSSGPPVSLVTGEVYEPSEAQNRTFQEGPLPLQTNVGNTVSTTSGSSTSVQNDGNAANTVWQEATQSGGPASNWSVDNSGNFQVNQWDGTTKKLLFQTIANAAASTPSVKALVAGLIMEVVGQLWVDQALTLGNQSLVVGKSSDATTGNIFGVDSSGNTFIQHHTKNNQTIIYDKNGSTLVTIDATGNITHNNNTTLKWKDTGGIARSIFQVNNFNQTQIFGITGTDVLQFLKSDGTVEALIDLVKGCFNLSTPSTVTNGGTAGTATMWMPFQGSSFKLVLIRHSGFQTGASNQDVALPTAFVDGCYFFTGGCSAFQLLNSGTAQNVNIVTALAAAGGTSVFQSTINGFSFGNCPPTEPFDTIRYISGNASTHNAFILLVGR